MVKKVKKKKVEPIALKVKYRKVSELSDYENNARVHSADQITEIVDSIEEFGFTNPILIDENDGIIAGHGRKSAALVMGLVNVPTILLAGLSKAQKRAYTIADNQLSINAEWDINLLKFEVDSLADDGFDISKLFLDEGIFDGMSGLQENEEISPDSFVDIMELKFKLSYDQYHSVKKKLGELNESMELALLGVLGL